MSKVKILLVSTLIIVALLGMLMTVSGEEKPIIIRFQHIGTASETQTLHGPWARAVEKATGGRVKIFVYSSCELVPDENLLPALKSGVIDAAIYASICNPSLTDLGIIETVLPFGLANQREQKCFYEYKGYRDLVKEDFEEYGVHYVGPMYWDASLFLISSKPVKSISDLKGLKISSYEPLIKPFIDYGAVQINVPADELYLAGKTGVVDGLVWGGVTCYYLNSWHEVYPYLLDMSMGNWISPLIFSEDTWNSLPEDIQAIFEMSLYWAAERTRNLYYSNEGKYRSAFTISKFSEEDHQKIIQSAEKYWDVLAKKNERVATAIQLYKDYNKELNKTGWRGKY